MARESNEDRATYAGTASRAGTGRDPNRGDMMGRNEEPRTLTADDDLADEDDY